MTDSLVNPVSFILLVQFNLVFGFNSESTLILDESAVFEHEDKYASYIEASDTQLDYLCSTGSRCIPLGKCKLISQLMEKSCLLSNKLRELTCGYEGDEPMVCCPNGVVKNGQRPLLDQPTCGEPMLYNWWNNGYRGLGSMPWVVRVGFRNRFNGAMSWPCCGSIITQQVVLTSAHCALAQNSKQTISSVRVGEWDTSTNPDCVRSFCAHSVKDIPISHVIVHPGYEAKTFKHNIALLVLKQNINFSVTAQPVCLRLRSTLLAGQKGKLVGWGKLPGQTETPSVQQVVELPIIKRERCIQVYSDIIPVTQDHLCVGGDENKDACSGFGGAPLVYMDKSQEPKYYQVGIVSFGSDKCGTEGIPSVYTRVDKYTNWIKHNCPDDDLSE